MASDAPFTLPVEYLDEMGAIAEDLGVPSVPHMVLPFAGRLDRDRLARATRLLIEAEPILGCRLERTPRGLVWRSRTLDEVEWFRAITAPTYDAAMTEMFRLEAEQGDRNFVVRLMSLPDRDVLVASFHHSVADAQGTLECLYELAEIYTALGRDPSYRLEPNWTSRDNLEWQKNLSIAGTARTLLRDIEGLRYRPSRFIGMRTEHDFATWRKLPRDSAVAVSRRFSEAEFAEVGRVARSLGATRFAVLLAGFARAFVDLVQPAAEGPIRVMTPANLRRYTRPAPGRPSIRNIVVYAPCMFDPARHADFATSVRNATDGLDRMKRGMYGAPNPLAVMALKLPYRLKRRLVEVAIRRNMTLPIPPTLSHVGHVPEERLQFDGQTPDDVMLLAGALPLPPLIVAGTEYRGRLSLATGYQGVDLPVSRMHDFLKSITAELPPE
jgi:NRPS condensation-like uncharacterized protein